MTDQEKFDELVDVITELAAMMVTHVDPRVVAKLMTRLDAIRTPTEE